MKIPALRGAVLTVVCTLVMSPRARAQEVPAWAVSVWSGYSSDSRGPIGLVAGRSFFIGGVRLTRSVWRTGRVELRYAADIVPVAIAAGVPRAPLERIPDRLGGFVVDSDSSNVFGVGVSPIGFELFPFRNRFLEPFVTAAGGVIAFTRAVPFGNARKLNFAFDFGWGVMFPAPPGIRLAVGYRVHHISNAGTARENPGLDARLWYVSVAVR